ncbi:4'-phosphopantetheinyl transferase superfamily protein [Actinospica durhamensis]|uniref:4'-phosphopantetheinyl transferase superfamily protein n=1 Tax=Actinospica durhamensis TaxID=1508375 RepID=A0A941EY26_9ACTN|nr:4'-phosphopantetheinyl transferase superfamily protein [Actinospica durhamensis]MBR7838548.1 4'-phosphopantetheinyl transferase superfamily protein [Actinospica durhamensis]
MDIGHPGIPPQQQRGGPARALIEAIVSGPAVAVDTREDFGEEPLPGEAERVERAVPARRAEFATGRACARRALARLGLPPRPIPTGQRGEPRWPHGVVGSITHCAGYRGAVLARTSQIATIGIDAEPNAPLPDGVLETVSLPGERAWVARLSAAEPAVHWDRLLFCAKESVYKAWYPLAHRWLDFQDAAVTVDVAPGAGPWAGAGAQASAGPFAAHGRFTAELRVAGPDFHGRELTAFTGRWAVREGLILTAIVVSNQRPPTARCAIHENLTTVG